MKNTEKSNRQIIDDYDYLGKSCSVQDCTGLIPSAPANQEELEAYEDIYPYLPPKNGTAQNYLKTPKTPPKR